MTLEEITSLKEKYKNAFYLKIFIYDNTVVDNIDKYLNWNDSKKIMIIIDVINGVTGQFSLSTYDYDDIIDIKGYNKEMEEISDEL